MNLSIWKSWSFLFMYKIASNIYTKYEVGNHSLTKLSPRCQLISGQLHIWRPIFCSINTLLVNILQLCPQTAIPDLRKGYAQGYFVTECTGMPFLKFFLRRTPTRTFLPGISITNTPHCPTEFWVTMCVLELFLGNK